MGSHSLEMNPTIYRKLGNKLSDAFNDGKRPFDIAEASGLDEATLRRMSQGQQANDRIAVYSIVGIADALGIEPRRFFRELGGDTTPLSAMWIAQARETVAKRIIRRQSKRQGIRVIEPVQPYVEPEPEPDPEPVEEPKAAAIEIPTAIEIMVKIKAMDPETRWMVKEILDENGLWV
jgi:transcriptional regulator with XRE-family HTH domain